MYVSLLNLSYTSVLRRTERTKVRNNNADPIIL